MRSILFIVPMLAACDEIFPSICTNEARTSVMLELTDLDGAPISGADVTVSNDAFTEDCEEWDDGDYACGWEMEGALIVRADAEGYLADSIDVTVDSDECHIITEQASLTLEDAAE
ncbi:MAG: hypothetical protein AAFV53_10180 [Myxococcota bacterium]